uniref:sulfotransferase domain-containing protein n=1 Tax=Synechococcus sp. UW106 TaxID=368495 RepID=UPI0014833486|nr:sulfotransferase domain-containing protein [Synechococcus sp. UW106]
MKDRIDFLVAGVQKCGTTTLWKLLRQHPGICISNKKELHFFDQKLYKPTRENINDYHFSGWGVTKFDGTLLYGEATPKYVLVGNQGKPLYLSRIRDYNPNIKLIVLFRDPVARAHSQWYMLRKSNPNLPSFDNLVNQLIDGKQNRFIDILNRGRYGSIVANLISLFPPENSLFLAPVDLHQSIDEITAFLGASSFSYQPVSSLINNDKGLVLPSTVNKLRRFYLYEIQLFQRLTGADVSSWLD